MKKILNIFMAACIGMILTGCNNDFAQKEYDNVTKITQTEDHYAKDDSLKNDTEGGWTLTIGQFDGRETLWTEHVSETEEREVQISFGLAGGKAKLVFVNAQGDIITLMECLPADGITGPVTKTMTLQAGKNSLKLIGYDCQDIDLKIVFM